MPKDCDCEKHDEPNRIWDYIQGHDPKPVVNQLATYPGANGFQYDTNNATYVTFFNFSIIEGKTIKYFIELSKIEKIEKKKHSNTIITYLKCKKQFTHEFTVDRSIIDDIINKISNGNFDAIPHDASAFNTIITNVIKQVEAKEGLKTKATNYTLTKKSLTYQGCRGRCGDNGKNCGSGGCNSCSAPLLQRGRCQ
jgi:hypothetical protein